VQKHKNGHVLPQKRPNYDQNKPKRRKKREISQNKPKTQKCPTTFDIARF